MESKKNANSNAREKTFYRKRILFKQERRAGAGNPENTKMPLQK